jgi:hypothetical protein
MAVEFDDMDTDWIPHGTIKRMLTAERISDRILGQSKTATVGTRTLFLGSGNNVGPVRDLSRRVLTIRIDARTSVPATLKYAGSPVEAVRQRRGHYVSLVLTIIRAWQAAGQPMESVSTIASYSGAWSHYCRQSLLWLGLPDPATSLLEQLRHDPDGEALHALMNEWHRLYQSRTVTVRRVTDDAAMHPNLNDAIHELPVIERGEINRSKLGWFLKKNANRIVNGMEFKKGSADGRNGWSVVHVHGERESPFAPPKPSQEMDDDLPF